MTALVPVASDFAAVVAAVRSLTREPHALDAAPILAPAASYLDVLKSIVLARAAENPNRLLVGNVIHAFDAIGVPRKILRLPAIVDNASLMG